MPECSCSIALRHSFSSARDVVMGNEYDKIIASSDQIARSEAKWMSLYRCRVCATLWAEACYDRGQVYFYYLFPAPPTDDPVRWLQDEANELPSS